MKQGLKITFWTIGIGAAIYLALKGAQKVADANTFINNLQFSVKPGEKPIKITSLYNLQLNLDLFITNPTKMTLSFEKPVVTIFCGDTILAQSKISEKQTMVNLKPQAITTISMTFDVSILSNWSTWLAIGQQLGKDISSQTGAKNIANTIASNAETVMQMLKVKILTYVGETPISYETAIV